jgi:RhoGAP domain
VWLRSLTSPLISPALYEAAVEAGRKRDAAAAAAVLQALPPPHRAALQTLLAFFARLAAAGAATLMCPAALATVLSPNLLTNAAGDALVFQANCACESEFVKLLITAEMQQQQQQQQQSSTAAGSTAAGSGQR